MYWCWSNNTDTACSMLPAMFFTSDLCFCFKTYSVVQRFATSSSAHHIFFFPQLYNVSGCLSIAGWKIIRTGCVCVQHKRKSRSRCKKNPKHRLKYDSSVYLPDFLYISSFRIFSPLCCCSRVCPVEFFNFSLSRLIYEKTDLLLVEKKTQKHRKTLKQRKAT